MATFELTSNYYELIKGFGTKRLIRLRGFYRTSRDTAEQEGRFVTKDDQERLTAINKELRLRTKRRYGKAV